jgi:Lsr2
MAKKTVVTEILLDDIDGSAGERSYTFTWDGTAYEIELSRKNAAAFEKTLKPYLDAARRVKSPRARRTTSSRGSRRDLHAVRAWATANGFEVSARGRVATAVLEAYEAANG